MKKTRLTPGERNKVLALNVWQTDAMQNRINNLVKTKEAMFELQVTLTAPEIQKLVILEIEDIDAEIVELNRQQYQLGSLYGIEN